MVDVAEVKIWGELVGAVRWDEEQQIGYFQYEPKFLQKGWDLSPIKMPIEKSLNDYAKQAGVRTDLQKRIHQNLNVL